MKSALTVLVVVAVIFAGALIFAGKKGTSLVGNGSQDAGSQKHAIVNVGGSHLIASVASSQRDRTQGLSNVHSIGPNEAKLFVFEKEGYHEFWMKDMKFNIDIIWVNDLGTVVDVRENVAPNTYPESFKPMYPASKVLEVNAGWVAENKVKVGDQMLWTELK